MRRLYRNKPRWVANVIISRDSGESSIWWYACLRSILLKTVAPTKSGDKSSIVGIGCFSFLIASLAHLISTHIHTSPFGLGAGTIGDTHFDGPVTGLIISRARSSLIWSAILSPWGYFRIDRYGELEILQFS